MTTEDLMQLADTYARCNANYHVENLYGTSGSYTEDCARQQRQARQAGCHSFNCWLYTRKDALCVHILIYHKSIPTMPAELL